MEKVTRISVTIPENLLKEFDKTSRIVGYRKRSRAVSEAIRKFIVEHKLLEEMKLGDCAGTVTYTYNHEIREKYGEKIVHQKDLVDVDVKILDAEESIFMPSTYKVEETICRSPKIKVDIDELVSYEGLYCGIFSEGEWVSVRGVLEEVEDKRKGKSYFRVVVGSLKAKGKDYIKPKS